MEATTGADLLRFAFLVAAAIYAGIAFAVLRRYFTHPPRSRLRRLHVIGVSAGTTIIVFGDAAYVAEHIGEPIFWYGAPISILGILTIIAALVALFVAESRGRRGFSPDATDEPLSVVSDAGPGQRAAEAARQAHAASRAGDAARATEAADRARASSLAADARGAEASSVAERAHRPGPTGDTASPERTEPPKSKEGKEAEEGQRSDTGGAG